jgi:hypothetical protein
MMQLQAKAGRALQGSQPVRIADGEVEYRSWRRRGVRRCRVFIHVRYRACSGLAPDS